jgi:hypothetical protein
MSDLNQMRELFPNCWEHIISRKFLIPTYRQNDYASIKLSQTLQFHSLTRARWERMGKDASDEEMRRSIADTISILHWFNSGERTLFLEKELAQLLAATDLPANICLSDIRARFPAVEIRIPRGTLVDEKGLELAGLFISHPQFRDFDNFPIPRWIDSELADFFDKLTAALRKNPESKRQGFLKWFCITAYRSDDENTCQPSGYGIPINGTFEEFCLAVNEDEHKSFYARVLHLCLNIWLFLSARPLEYEQGKIVRKLKSEGKRVIPELRKAVFVGQMGYRPRSKTMDRVREEIHGGRKLSPHLRAGHWKHQRCGHAGLERKLIWIMPYRTGEPEST